MQDQSPKGSTPPSVEFDEASFKRKLGTSVKLQLLFCVVYFVAALIATRDLKHIGSFEILGMPLALYTGILVFIVGIVVTRMCLAQDNKKD